MILIDIIFSIYSPIIFLPFFSYLLKKKRRFVMYILYGLLLDIILINYYLFNTIFLIIIYTFILKKKVSKFKFLIIYNLFMIINLIAFSNIFYILSFSYFLSFIINYSYFKLSNKTDFF